MATFYVPNPPIDDPELIKPRPSNTLRLLTQQVIYGKGGQVPTPTWGDVYTQDDPPMWQGSPTPSWVLRELTQGGQPPTPKWLPRYTQDDASGWQYPFNRNTTLLNLLKTQNPFVPLYWQFGRDDAAEWSGSPAANNLIRELTQGGQPPTPKWLPRYTQDDASEWVGKPTSDNTLRLLTQGTPFKPSFGPFWRDDASEWVGVPTSDNTIRLLTQGGQPPTPEWLPRYTQDDPAFWQGTPVPSWILRELTQGGQPPTPRWLPRYTQDDESTWAYAFHKNDSLFGSLVVNKPSLPSFWPFGLDDQSVWDRQTQLQRFLGLPDIQFSPVAKPTFWKYVFDEPDWYAKSVPLNVNLASTIQFPAIQRFFWSVAEEEDWQFAFNRNIAVLNSLGVQTPQLPHFWPFGQDDAPAWDRQTQLQRFLGQPDIKFVPSARPFFWKNDYDDPGSWNGPIAPRPISLQGTPFKPVATPSFWKYVHDEPDWYAKPLPSWIIRELTQQTPFKAKPWNYNVDDPGVWAIESLRNQALLSSLVKFRAFWAANSNIVVGGVAT